MQMNQSPLWNTCFPLAIRDATRPESGSNTRRDIQGKVYTLRRIALPRRGHQISSSFQSRFLDRESVFCEMITGDDKFFVAGETTAQIEGSGDRGRFINFQLVIILIIYNKFVFNTARSLKARKVNRV